MRTREQFKSNFGAATLVLFPVAMVINLCVGYRVSLWNPPLFPDSIGTVLVGLRPSAARPYGGSVPALWGSGRARLDGGT